jgi:hypothetical protein
MTRPSEPGIRSPPGAAKHAEVEEPEGELGVARRNALESKSAGLVSAAGELARVHDEIDCDARKNAAALIDDAATDCSGRLPVDGDVESDDKETEKDGDL